MPGASVALIGCRSGPIGTVIIVSVGSRIATINAPDDATAVAIAEVVVARLS